MKKLLPLLAASLLASCAPMVKPTAKPTMTTTTAQYRVALKAGEDNPVLAAIVGIAPSAPRDTGRQAWRAEEIEKNSLVLRANASEANVSTFSSFMSTLPQEMSWNVISASGITTVSATYSTAYAASADYIFTQLEKRFQRVAQ